MEKKQAVARDVGVNTIERNRIITREGKEVDVSTDIWNLPYSSRDSAILEFNRVANPQIREALKLYISDSIKRISTHSGYSVFQDVWREVLRYWNPISDEEDTEAYLISLFEMAIENARTNKRLWAMYRPIRWYIWASENVQGSLFSELYAHELEVINVPGNPKGEAVRMEDPEFGPLNKSFEVPLLIKALKADKSTRFRHLQQKVVVALLIAFGRNPANLTYLREADFHQYKINDTDVCCTLSIPRIKKRQISPRDDLLDEYLDPSLSTLVQRLIEANQLIDLNTSELLFNTPEQRPLLINKNGNRTAILSNDSENVFNYTSSGISRLLKEFVARHNILSPLTGRLMKLSPRRLRYTLATGLAAEGMSKRELARILDHTDTQHVDVYYEMGGKIVEHLDKAAAKGFSEYIDFFKGMVIDSDEDAVNGERDDKHLRYVDDQNPANQEYIGVCGESSACHLDPPFSCYLCPKFQPYRQADHESVLECLLSDREYRLEKYDNARLGIQLDEVIAAVAQVAKLCEEGGHDV